VLQQDNQYLPSIAGYSKKLPSRIGRSVIPNVAEGQQNNPK